MGSPEILNDKNQPWEGPQGRRGNGTAVTPYAHEDTNAWLRQLGLPLMKDGETITDWYDRTHSLEATEETTQTEQSVELGGVDGQGS